MRGCRSERSSEFEFERESRRSFEMRRFACTWLVGSAVAGLGCFDSADDCNEIGKSCDPGATGTSTGGAGSGGSGGEGGQGGSGGGTPDECVPSKLASGKALAENCGVFVDGAAGVDGSEGTVLAPLKSLGAALVKAEGKPIYVCAAAAPVEAGVVIGADQDVFGGLACDTWTYSGEASAVAGSANVPAIQVEGAVAVRFEDLAVTAATATEAGAHSIALLSLGADVTLARVALRAGDGADGAAGMDGGAQEQVVAAMNGATGKAAGAASTPENVAGGANTCAAQPLTGGVGGRGGDKDMPVKDGGNGTSGDSAAGGIAGSGQGDGTFDCTPGVNGGGGPGGPGQPGSPGAGGTGLGLLNGEGLQGRNGEAGGNATHGESGGGGGGSKANASTYGAGGGGGGAGGCAGKSGGGGQAGGSSIALAAVGGSLSFEAVQLSVGVGATGGNGGNGQIGQNGGAAGPGGGDGGTALAPACSGGGGGKGGNGGNGGGGAGGHAIGLAHAGTTLTGMPTVDLDAAQVGDGGDGGNNGGTEGFAGEPGTMGEVEELGG
jgi:hypothetical protein